MTDDLTTAEVKTRAKIKLGGGARFQPSDFAIARYAASVPAGTKLEDVMSPEYFQNHLGQMRPGMEINVLSEDFALDCTIRVLTVTKTTAKMRLIRLFSEDQSVEFTPVSNEEIKVRFAGAHHKWRVEHAGEVVQFGFATQAEADAAAALYLEKVNN